MPERTEAWAPKRWRVLRIARMLRRPKTGPEPAARHGSGAELSVIPEAWAPVVEDMEDDRAGGGNAASKKRSQSAGAADKRFAAIWHDTNTDPAVGLAPCATGGTLFGVVYDDRDSYKRKPAESLAGAGQDAPAAQTPSLAQRMALLREARGMAQRKETMSQTASSPAPTICRSPSISLFARADRIRR